jgi:hypothetical protein
MRVDEALAIMDKLFLMRHPGNKFDIEDVLTEAWMEAYSSGKENRILPSLEPYMLKLVNLVVMSTPESRVEMRGILSSIQVTACEEGKAWLSASNDQPGPKSLISRLTAGCDPAGPGRLRLNGRGELHDVLLLLLRHVANLLLRRLRSAN